MCANGKAVALRQPGQFFETDWFTPCSSMTNQFFRVRAADAVGSFIAALLHARSI